MGLFRSLHNPAGPSLSSTNAYAMDLSGNQLAFAMPKSNDPYKLGHYPKSHGQQHNIYTPMQEMVGDEEILLEPISGLSLLWCKYYFYGLPLVHGTLAISTSLITISTTTAFGNIFRPSRLTKLIERFLFKYSGPYNDRCSYHARELWRTLSIDGIEWVHTVSRRYKDSSVSKSYWQTPLSAQHLLTVEFERDTLHPKAALDNFFNRYEEGILQSFRIQYSSQSAEEKSEAKTHFPQEVLPKHLPPLHWEAQPADTLSDAAQKIQNANPGMYWNEAKQRAVTLIAQQETAHQKQTEENLQSHVAFSD